MNKSKRGRKKACDQKKVSRFECMDSIREYVKNKKIKYSYIARETHYSLPHVSKTMAGLSAPKARFIKMLELVLKKVIHEEKKRLEEEETKLEDVFDSFVFPNI